MREKELFITLAMCFSILFAGIALITYVIVPLAILATISVSFFCLFLVCMFVLISLNN